MVRREDVELIRNRALSMLRAAQQHLASGDYDLAAFMAEQATQLFLKYKILELSGEMPRTLVIRQLLGILGEISKTQDKISRFVRENKSIIIRLEEAHIASRYLFKRYEKDEVEDLVDFAEKVIDFVRNIQIPHEDEKYG